MADHATPTKGEIDPFKEVVDSAKFEFSESWNNLHGLHLELPKIGEFQITKFQILLTISAIITAIILIYLGRKMRHGETPRGWLWNGVESLYFFVRDNIARAGLGADGDKYTPFLTTLFVFILITNLLGMVPFLGSATASIAVTFSLAIVAFVVIHVSGVKENGFGTYMKSFIPHFHMEGGPAMKLMGFFLTIGMAILEYATVFIRLAVLAIRLFANMLAGHTALFMILFFIQMVARPLEEGGGFLHPNSLPTWLYYPVTLFSVLMATALGLLEIFVAGLQAFIFTLLTSIFIGLAKHPAH